MSLEDLIRHPKIWKGLGGDVPREQAFADVVPTGFPALDALLSGGGWPQRAITEVFVDRYGIGELSLFMPALVRLGTQRPIVWIAPPFLPYAPALARHGLDPGRTWLVLAGAEIANRFNDDLLWAVEQALLSAPGMVVLAWLAHERHADLRRLQLAAEDENGWVVFFRPGRACKTRSPAALRLRLSAITPGVRVEILKCRGGRPGTVDLDLSARDLK